MSSYSPIKKKSFDASEIDLSDDDLGSVPEYHPIAIRPRVGRIRELLEVRDSVILNEVVISCQDSFNYGMKKKTVEIESIGVDMKMLMTMVTHMNLLYVEEISMAQW